MRPSFQHSAWARPSLVRGRWRIAYGVWSIPNGFGIGHTPYATSPRPPRPYARRGDRLLRLHLPPTGEPEGKGEGDHQGDAEGGAERPVAGVALELVLDDVADHVDLAAAEDVVDGIEAQGRDEHEQDPGGDARRR